MNILLTAATGYPSPDTGGPNKIIYNLLKDIKKENITIDYISKHFWKDSNQKLTIDSLNLLKNKIYLNSQIFRSIVTHPFYLKYHYKNLKNFFESKNDLLSSYDCLNAHDIVSFYYLRNYKKKKILSVHSKGSFVDELNDKYMSSLTIGKQILNEIRTMEQIAFNEASYVTFPSIAAKNMFLEALGKEDNEKIKVIYNGVDIDEIRNVMKSKDILEKYKIPNEFSRYIFNVANHVKVKNVDKLILAIEILVKKYGENICLINAGIGPLYEEFVKLVKRLGIENNIFFIDIIPNEDIIKLMKYCDFFIMPSDRVVFDMVVLEALASGTIVIASCCGGNKEIIEDSINGYFLYSCEPEEIAQKVLGVNNKVILGATNTIKKFSLDTMIQRYLELYEN